MAKGRPRTFDVDQALDCALKVFWRKGYEGTSLHDLTEAMGINRPSLYAAFGNKEELFRKALDRYAAGPAAHMREALEEPTARAVVERLLRKTADVLTDPCHPPGCLAVQGALSCGEAAESIRQELNSRRSASEAALRERFERAKSETRPAAGRRPRRSRPLRHDRDPGDGRPGRGRCEPRRPTPGRGDGITCLASVNHVAACSADDAQIDLGARLRSTVPAALTRTNGTVPVATRSLRMPGANGRTLT